MRVAPTVGLTEEVGAVLGSPPCYGKDLSQRSELADSVYLGRGRKPP